MKRLPNKQAFAKVLDQSIVLHQVLGTAAAPRYRLQRIISTREANHKAGSPPNTLEDLEQYADGTVAQVQALQVSHRAEQDARPSDPVRCISNNSLFCNKRVLSPSSL